MTYYWKALATIYFNLLIIINGLHEKLNINKNAARHIATSSKDGKFYISIMNKGN